MFPIKVPLGNVTSTSEQVCKITTRHKNLKKCKYVTGPAITYDEDSKYNVETISLEEKNSNAEINYVSKFNKQAPLCYKYVAKG